MRGGHSPHIFHVFQSAPPAKGAINFNVGPIYDAIVSIRAPREGGDAVAVPTNQTRRVSIRAPREGGDTRT